MQKRRTPPDVQTLVLAAVEDSWRDLQGTLSLLTGREMDTPGVLGELSVKDVISHVTLRDASLLCEVTSGRARAAAEGEDQVEVEKAVREVMADFEQTHHALKKALVSAPGHLFDYGSEIRRRIDEGTVLHYQEHGTHIRAWLKGRRVRAAEKPGIRLSQGLGEK